jgi:uncharacterized lipoprotein YddW (UPF0748 family)
MVLSGWACKSKQKQPAAGAMAMMKKASVSLAAGDPPPADREMRAAFIVTAYNTDWPAKADNDPGAGHQNNQKAQIPLIAKRLKENNFNVVILQCRSFGDRLHKNTKTKDIWAKSLNKGNASAYDPLDDWIVACHDEGLEVHCWINPFRMDWKDTNLDPNPIEWKSKWGWSHWWYHDTATKMRDYVVNEVVPELLHYVGDRPRASANDPVYLQTGGDEGDGGDGVLIDHNVPPEPPPGGGTQPSTSPGTGPSAKTEPRPTRMAAQFTGSDLFVQALYQKMHDEKPWAKLGISPEIVHANPAETWLAEGWLHYLAPEMYQDLGDFEFKTELDNWRLKNTSGKDPLPIIVPALMTLWTEPLPGSNNAKWPVDKIKNHISVGQTWSRSYDLKGGQAHYCLSGMKSTAAGHIMDELKKGPYAKPALVPQCVPNPPAAPQAPQVTPQASGKKITVAAASGEKHPKLWELWTRDSGSDWELKQLVDGHKTELQYTGNPKSVSVRSVDYYDQESPAVTFNP